MADWSVATVTGRNMTLVRSEIHAQISRDDQ
jgi:hypothetical protein